MLRDAESGAKQAGGHNAVLAAAAATDASSAPRPINTHPGTGGATRQANSHDKSHAHGARYAGGHNKSHTDGTSSAYNADAADGPDSSASPDASCGQPGRQFCCNTPAVRLFPC